MICFDFAGWRKWRLSVHQQSHGGDCGWSGRLLLANQVFHQPVSHQVWRLHSSSGTDHSGVFPNLFFSVVYCQLLFFFHLFCVLPSHLFCHLAAKEPGALSQSGGASTAKSPEEQCSSKSASLQPLVQALLCWLPTRVQPPEVSLKICFI